MSRGSSPWRTRSSARRMEVNPGAKKHSPSPWIPSSVSILTKVQSKLPSTTAVFKRTIFIWSFRVSVSEPLVRRVLPKLTTDHAHSTNSVILRADSLWLGACCTLPFHARLVPPSLACDITQPTRNVPVPLANFRSRVRLVFAKPFQPMRHHRPARRLCLTNRVSPAFPAAEYLTVPVQPEPPALCPVAARHCPSGTQPLRFPVATSFPRGKPLLPWAIAKRRHRRGRVPDESWANRGGGGLPPEIPSLPVASAARCNSFRPSPGGFAQSPGTQRSTYPSTVWIAVR